MIAGSVDTNVLVHLIAQYYPVMGIALFSVFVCLYL